MKTPAMLKISLVLLGLGAMLWLSPSARAQSEVSPDHFDGTDPWEVALAHKSAARVTKGKASAAVQQAQKRTNDTRTVPQTQPVALVTVQKQRKLNAAPKDHKKR